MEKVSKLLEKSKKLTEPKMIKNYERAFFDYNLRTTEYKLDIKDIDVLHAYAVHISQTIKPTTLNTTISYIKNCLKMKNIVEFSKE